MSRVVPIPLPLAHVGSVNAWVLAGEPLTLVDTGPRDPGALTELEDGLRRLGLRLEDVELVLATHHHFDHVGLAATIRRRAGATIAALDRVAGYTEHYARHVEEDRAFAHRLMAHHGVPAGVIEADESFWDLHRRCSEDVTVDLRLTDGDHVRAGGRTLRVVARPGHSTTDTLFVDDQDRLAFSGDHLLATISSNTEISAADRADDGRARSRLRYLESLRRTAAMPLDRLLTGHGPPVTDHARLVAERLAEHELRCERIAALLTEGPRTAYEIAQGLWRPATVVEQPLLVVFEVVGHLELLIAAGHVTEQAEDPGSRFALTPAGRAPGAGPSLVRGRRAPRRRPSPRRIAQR